MDPKVPSSDSIEEVTCRDAMGTAIKNKRRQPKWLFGVKPFEEKELTISPGPCYAAKNVVGNFKHPLITPTPQYSLGTGPGHETCCRNTVGYSAGVGQYTITNANFPSVKAYSMRGRNSGWKKYFKLRFTTCSNIFSILTFVLFETQCAIWFCVVEQ